MAKSGRNDVCSCGSGKKYKNCCGKNNVVSLERRIDMELNDIQLDILRYAMKNYHEDIEGYLEECYEEYNIPDEAMDLFHFFACTWYITSMEVAGKTIFEEYIDRFLHTQNRQRIKDILQSWKNVRPSIYTILEQDENLSITVQDLFTNEKQKVKIFEEDHFVEPKGMILGTILPVGEASIFFTTFLDLTSVESKERDKQILHLYEMSGNKSSSEFMSEYFLEVLDIFIFGKVEVAIDDLEWISPKHKEVAEYYHEYIRGCGYDQTLINLGIFLWNQYCLRENPIIKKMNLYIATLIYLVLKLFPFGDELTQIELAEEFGVSGGSISTKCKDIEAVLAEDIEDLLGEVYDE